MPHSAFPFYSLQKPAPFAPYFFTALSRMTFAVLPASTPLPCSLAELAHETGLSKVTVRNACEGRGTIASLDRVRHAAGWRWSWTRQTGPLRAGRALAGGRRAKGLPQRDMAALLCVSPQGVTVCGAGDPQVTKLLRFRRKASRARGLRGHPRFFGRSRTIYDLWHYVPVLVRELAPVSTGHFGTTMDA